MGYTENISDLKSEKSQAIRTAKELGYSKEVRNKIKKAKRVGDIYAILHDARLAM